MSLAGCMRRRPEMSIRVVVQKVSGMGGVHFAGKGGGENVILYKSLDAIVHGESSF
jgi:hypothetical protein